MGERNIAVIGAGISGIVAGHYLAKKHKVTIFEAQNRLGGHTNTVQIPETKNFGQDAFLPVDTGFIVYNDKTYPNFIRFLDDLKIKGSPTDMSFSFYDEKRKQTYAGTDLSGLFAKKSNIFNPAYWWFLKGILSFNRTALEDLKKGVLKDITLKQYLNSSQISKRVKTDYLGPMTQAIWSAPYDDALNYPAETFIRFFDNHGLLSMPGKIVWRYLKGGSHTYLRAFEKQFKGEIKLSSPVLSVIRTKNGPEVSVNGESLSFDSVILATHADQALEILSDADAMEKDALKPWRYSLNHTVLHCDERHLPPNKKAWACWNVKRKPQDGVNRPVRVTYWMNRLQRLPAKKNWLVSLNSDEDFAKESVAFENDYEHPIFDLSSLKAQTKLPYISGRKQTYFCGAYHGYGFHEDGAKSAVKILKKHFGVVL